MTSIRDALLGLPLLLAAGEVVLARAQEPSPTEPRERSLVELTKGLPRVEIPWLYVASSWEGGVAAAVLGAGLRAGETMPDALWRKALLETGTIRVRKRWPVDVPFAVNMHKPAWLGPALITLTRRGASVRTATRGAIRPIGCGTCQFDSNCERHFEFGYVELGEQAIDFDVRIERGMTSNELIKAQLKARRLGVKSGINQGSPPPVLWSGALKIEVEGVASLDDALPPVCEREHDAAVREALSLAFRSKRRGQPQSRSGELSLAAPDDRALHGLGLSLNVELLKGDTVMEQLHLLATSPGAGPFGRDPREGWKRPLQALPRSLESDSADRSAWSVRVVGVETDALRLWDATQRWDGELTLSLDELLERGRELADERARRAGRRNR